MKNIFKSLIVCLVAMVVCAGVVFASNSFPTTLNNWQSGDIIEEGWGNSLEAKIGVNNSTVATSLDYLIKNTSSILGKIASLTTTDGNFIVGDGSSWIAESGNTARTSLGLGTGDSPAFTGLTMSGDIVAGDNSITGIDTLTFTDVNGTIAGVANGNLLDKSASETISGEWTYSVFPITPSSAPDADYEVANKKYVDDNSGAGGDVSKVGTPANNQVGVWTGNGTLEGTADFLIDDDGIVTKVKQSSASAYLDSGDQTVPDNEWVKILLDAEDFDIQGEMDIRSFTGTADATEANKLHDADGAFDADLATVNAMVWNTTDDTYATVTGFTDSGELTLDTDIMASGEGYIVYVSRFVAKVAGRYLATAYITIETTVADKLYTAAIKQNGAYKVLDGKQSSVTGQNLVVNPNRILNLAIGDYVELFIQAVAGETAPIKTGELRTGMSVVKLN